jgi:hypothetical protein
MPLDARTEHSPVETAFIIDIVSPSFCLDLPNKMDTEAPVSKNDLLAASEPTFCLFIKK